MNIKETPEYHFASLIDGHKVAERSQVPYMNHIDEGLVVLDLLETATETKLGYILHGILQSDNALAENYKKMYLHLIDPLVVLLAIEYRWVANNYLSTRTVSSLDEIQLSILPEVNQMLIADKVQNRKDFDLYHKDSHPRSKELTQYFDNWFRKLGITQEFYTKCLELMNNRIN